MNRSGLNYNEEAHFRVCGDEMKENKPVKASRPRNKKPEHNDDNEPNIYRPSIVDIAVEKLRLLLERRDWEPARACLEYAIQQLKE